MSNQPCVQIDRCEGRIVLAVARFRADRVITDNLGAGHGEADRSRPLILSGHRTGAMAELAYAKYWDVFWGGGSSDFGRQGDVRGVEVRGTQHRHGSLIVFGRDPDDRTMFSGPCEWQTGRVWLCGGILAARDGKLDKYLPPPGKLRPGSPDQWWVPQSDLIPFEELERLKWPK